MDEIKEEIKYETELLKMVWLTTMAIIGGSVGFLLGELSPLKGALAGSRLNPYSGCDSRRDPTRPADTQTVAANEKGAHTMTGMEWYAFVVGTALLGCLGVLMWKVTHH